MDDLEAIKRKKLEALQRQYQEKVQSQLEEEHQAQAQISQLESAIKTKLSKEALTRYGNLKTAHPEKAVQLLVVLAKLMQMGRIDKVSDEDLKTILQKMSADENKKTRIIHK